MLKKARGWWLRRQGRYYVAVGTDATPSCWACWYLQHPESLNVWYYNSIEDTEPNAELQAQVFAGWGTELRRLGYVECGVDMWRYND